MLLTTIFFAMQLVLGDSFDVGCCCGGGGWVGSLVGCGVCGVFWIAIYVVIFIGMWKMFDKAGEPGWAALVPIYNVMILAKMAGREPTEGLMVLIPIYGIYVMYLIDVDVAQAFGKEQGFAILMLLLPFVAFPMLGFGNAKYRGAGVKKSRRDDMG